MGLERIPASEKAQLSMMPGFSVRVKSFLMVPATIKRQCRPGDLSQRNHGKTGSQGATASCRDR